MGATNATRSNIILVVLDTHRRDRLGCCGYSRGTSPNLDAFARTGSVFENAISPAQWTIPSHASMFTGEYPSTHLTVQADSALSPRYRTLAEILHAIGYRTIGFCNNPLVGVLDNGIKRGFETFYNYGGAIPSIPQSSNRLPGLLSRLWESYTQWLRKISYPIQNAVARSDKLFQLSLNSSLVPLWTRFTNFKGDTARSIRDAAQFVTREFQLDRSGPYFLFINLMETHLPFFPPDRFVKTFAPYFAHDRAARDFMRVYNTQALRWLLPMAEPFSELEARVLSDLYDAEVAYQDHLLAEFLAALDQSPQRDNTLVMFVADHGEMLGEHQLMGHGFGVYRELVHVPLFMRFPGQIEGQRIDAPVSTTQVFHTALDVAGFRETQIDQSLTPEVRRLSLRPDVQRPSIRPSTAISEAYAPNNVLKIMDQRRPELIEKFSARRTYRALYDQPDKAIFAEEALERLFNTNDDVAEQHDRLPETAQQLKQKYQDELREFLANARLRQAAAVSSTTVNLDDELLQQRLRSLGYIE